MFDLSGPPEIITFAIIGNVLNLGYNIPFVWLVWKNRSSKNISGMFLSLRFFGSISWLIYAGLIKDAWVAISNTVTLVATLCIGYVKIIERKRNTLTNTDVIPPAPTLAPTLRQISSV